MDSSAVVVSQGLKVRVVEWIKADPDRFFAPMLGLGAAMCGLHWKDQPWKSLVFIPDVGFVMIVFCLMYYYQTYFAQQIEDSVKQRRLLVDLGPKIVWLPMLVIIGSVAVSAFWNPSKAHFAGIGYVLFMFGAYLLARKMGRKVFWAFIPVAGLVMLTVVVRAVIEPGHITGGLISNYCASAAFLLFAAVVNKVKWQWVLVSVLLVGVMLVGSLEALMACVVLGGYMVLRKDWGWRLLLPIGVLGIAVMPLVVTGNLDNLYRGNGNLSAVKAAITEGDFGSRSLDDVSTDRWSVAVNAMKDIRPFGHGYNPNEATDSTVHNAALILVDQVGVLAGAAWLLVSLWCLWKTKWKYAWVLVLILGMVDHYWITQLAPIWWILVGASTVTMAEQGRDYIFRREAA